MTTTAGEMLIARRRQLVLGLMGLLTAVLTLVYVPQAGATPHYQFMVQQRTAGVPVGCNDLKYAAVQRLIEPGEVLALEDRGITCGNRNYTLILALGARGLLTCADVDWNAGNGYLNWTQASEVLQFVPGCQLSNYSKLVAIAANKALSCADVNFWQTQGLISPAQGGWLRALVASLQGAPCPLPQTAPASVSSPPVSSPQPVTQPSVYYENCSAVWAAGAAPIHRGSPGYRAALDSDNDGVGCEIQPR